MKVLTDENIDPVVVSGLKAAKYQVIDEKSLGWQGASDARLISEAKKHRACNLTHDKDFLRSSEVGVLILALRRPQPALVLQRVRAVLADGRCRTALRRRRTIVLTDRGTQILS